MSDSADHGQTRRARSVLVVDDEPQNIAIIVELLRRMDLGSEAGGKIYSAPNGRVGLELARRFRPDLILADWQMPEMSGVEMVRLFRTFKETENIPVVMITAVRTDPESMQEAFDAGVRDFLQKPFVDLEFFARVKNTLQLQETHDALATNLKTIEEQNELLRDSVAHQRSLNRLKDQIFAVISHDFRSPLSTLTSMTKLQASGIISQDPDEQKAFNDRMLLRLNSTLTLLDNLLDWSVLGLSTQRGPFPPTPARGIVDEVFALYAEAATAKSVDLRNEVSESAAVTVSKDLMSFIVRNLVANAIKFTSDGEITVRGEEQVRDSPGRWLRFSVADTGVGMTDAVREALFQTQQVAPGSGTAGEKGTGVGLLFTHDFVTRQGGEIWVESEPGVGTTFFFTVPG